VGYFRWSAEEVKYLEGSYGVVAIEVIAAKLRRSMGSVQNKAQGLGLGPLHRDELSLHAVMLALGLDAHATVRAWVETGKLRGRRDPESYGRPRPLWKIREQDLAAFLREYPHLIDRDRVEPSYRHYVPERWITLPEAFRRGAAHPFFLEAAMKSGLVPEARQRGAKGTWWVVPETLLPHLIAARRRMTADRDHRRLVLRYTQDQAKGRLSRGKRWLAVRDARAAAAGGHSSRNIGDVRVA